MSYVLSLVALKLTIMMLVTTKYAQPQPRNLRMASLSESLSIESSSPPVDIVENDLKNQKYWKMLENIEVAEIEATATNRTKGSSIWS